MLKSTIKLTFHILSLIFFDTIILFLLAYSPESPDMLEKSLMYQNDHYRFIHYNLKLAAFSHKGTLL